MPVIDPFDFLIGHGHDFDRRQRFVGSYVWDIPGAGHGSAALKYVTAIGSSAASSLCSPDRPFHITYWRSAAGVADPE